MAKKAGEPAGKKPKGFKATKNSKGEIGISGSRKPAGGEGNRPFRTGTPRPV